MRRKIWIGGTAAAIMVGVLGAVAVVAAQTGSDAATDQLNKIAARGQDNAIVATVNGAAITRRAIDVQSALAMQGEFSDAAGRPIATLSQEELLDREIETVLLSQAAERAGVVVTDDEVSLSIRSGLIDPLSSPDTPAEIKRTGLAALAAAGLSLADAEQNLAMREAYHRFILLQRYAAVDKTPREQRLATAKANAKIEIHLDVLNAAR